jgi:hypothetical protein
MQKNGQFGLKFISFSSNTPQDALWAHCRVIAAQKWTKNMLFTRCDEVASGLRKPMVTSVFRRPKFSHLTKNRTFCLRPVSEADAEGLGTTISAIAVKSITDHSLTCLVAADHRNIQFLFTPEQEWEWERQISREWDMVTREGTGANNGSAFYCLYF